jgi:hypothetical protein
MRLTAIAAVMSAVLSCAMVGPEQHNGETWRVLENAASQTVRAFYEQLLVEQCSPQCTELLTGTAIFLDAIPQESRSRFHAQAPTDAVWEYLRQHKDIFMLAGIRGVADVPDIRLRYVARSLDERSWKEPGSLGVVAFHALRIGGTEGVFKEVYFPLESASDSRSGFRVNLPGIRVNGIGLDPEESRDRSRNLYELLGFR